MTTKAKTRRRRRPKKWLVFVDTNVLLDFYRIPGESAKRQLATLEKHQASLIMTDQVWMEFLKNRQKVVAKAMTDIAKPIQKNMPSMLNELPAVRKFFEHQRTGLHAHNKLISAIEKLLRNPNTDPVYRCLSRIFAGDAKYNLRRPNKKRYDVRDLAQKRFSLGYPPRKDDTLRLGDAINWEWIISCAQTSNCHVVIVSRDGDFGLSYDQECILNDWLRVEFKERVSRNRKIELTNKLATALKKLDIAMAPADVSDEINLIASDIPDSAVLFNEMFSRMLLQSSVRARPERALMSRRPIAEGILWVTPSGSSWPSTKCCSIPSTAINALRRATTRVRATIMMTQGSLSQIYASQNIGHL